MGGGIEDWDERVFAQTVAVLYKRGMSELVQLLLEAEKFEFVYEQERWGEGYHTLTLDVEDYVVPLFTEALQDQLKVVVNEVVERVSEQPLPVFIAVRAAPPAVDADWRSTYGAGEQRTDH